MILGIISHTCFSREGYRMCMEDVLFGRMILNFSPEFRERTDCNSMFFKFD